MRIVVADWETRFDSQTYTLSKMSTEAYLRDPRFEAHGCAIKWEPTEKAVWYGQEEIKQVMADEDWSDVFMIHHHAQFDSAIEAWHYDCHPAMIGCTLSMARLLLGNHLSVSLDAVRKHFGMPTKITPYREFDGKRWSELSSFTRTQMALGACDEVESIWKIFGLLMKDFPREELAVVDQTIKMFSNPVLRGDIDLLAKVWKDENTNKVKRLAELNITEAQLQSADQFADLLRQQGVEPEVKNGKVDPKTGQPREIYAFAKTDQFMRDLQEHEDETVQALVVARLGVKSTILQTRAETLGFMATRGAMPVYLRYCGAHTTRFSGGDNCNWQNLNGTLEAAVSPPEGYWAFTPDLSQVECRLLNGLAGQEDKIEEFRQGLDPYVGVAEAFCGHKVTKESHPELRQMGKVVELQAGFGSGALKIKATLRNKVGIIITDDEAEGWKKGYRDTHPKVVDLWKTGGRMIARLAGGDPIEWGPTLVKDHKIYLPNGCPLNYETLEHHQDVETGESYWRLKTRNGWAKMYGAKLIENWIQALARVVATQAMLRINQLGFRTVNMKHDSLWVLIPKDNKAEHNRQLCLAEMRRQPTWLPQIPLDAEGVLSERYSK